GCGAFVHGHQRWPRADGRTVSGHLDRGRTRIMSSARAKRMEKHHKRSKPAALSLVSLMDIFTILVFFLLVNQAEVAELDVPQNIQLPESMAMEPPSQTVVVMVTPEQVLVQGEPVATIAEVDAQPTLLIAPLQAALQQQSDRILRASAQASIEDRDNTVTGAQQ